MRTPKYISPAFERVISPATGPGQPRRRSEPDHLLDLAVVYTSAPGTIAALNRAGALAQQLGARVTLVVPQVVPFQLPLESPPVLLEFSEQQLRRIAAESPIETTIRIYLCRDRFELLEHVLAPHSLVIVGGRRRWWPTSERRTARQLRRAGHEVIFTETE